MENNVVLVTGALQGIGRGIAETLLAQKAKVSICDILTAAKDETCAALKEKFGEENFTFIKCDVTSDEEFENAFKVTIERFGKVNTLVNNAGIIDESNYERVVDVNFLGVIRGMNLAFKYMGKHEGKEGGMVINIASVSGIVPLPYTPVYSATKHAVVGLSRAYATDAFYKITGVKVTCLCPHFVNTSILDRKRNDEPPVIQKVRDELEPIITGTWTQISVEDVANACLKILEKGKHGYVWAIVHGKEPYPVEFPKLFRKQN